MNSLHFEMLNKNIVKVYLNSQRSKMRIEQLFIARGLCRETTVSKDVVNWVRQFTRRWAISHGRDRFFEKHKDWLDKVYEVRITKIILLLLLYFIIDTLPLWYWHSCLTNIMNHMLLNYNQIFLKYTC